MIIDSGKTVKILFCCEFYYPSLGGVQVVMQQIAERLVAKGHDVTIATTRLRTRMGQELNGVRIEEFTISGNIISGMRGEIRAYQEFVKFGHFDVIMVKAAQQWTFDALWPVLDQIKSAKVFIPCGFSGLYEPAYAEYFKRLPLILHKFDHLIFYATDYRDINFTKDQGIANYSIVPNGASELEFNAQPDPHFRSTLGIGKDDFIFLTVGSLTGSKGHLEVAKAFDAADFEGHPATLILNGNKIVDNSLGALNRVLEMVHEIKSVVKQTLKLLLRKQCNSIRKGDGLNYIINSICNQPNKNVIVTDLPRPSLVQAFMAADFFVFASHVEYSPLVLFESAAAGTPFLTVPVGNSEEIAQWTGAGVICPAERDARGYTHVNPRDLAQFMSRLAKDVEYRQQLGTAGKKSWQEKFTWEKISSEYEKIFLRLKAEKVIKL
jgi:glycosyltransferase involved in cell wall biosynthesis